MKALTQLKVSAFYALGALPLVRPLVRRCRGVGAVLMYHQVFPRAERDRMAHPMAINVTSVERFEEQIAWLKDHCDLCTLDDLRRKAAASAAGAPADRLPVVVTFDDGHRDVLEHALPVLERHGAPATIYVASGFLDGSATAWWREIWDLMADRDAFTLDGPGPQQTWPLRTNSQRLRCFRELCARMRRLPLAQQAGVMDALRAGRPPMDYRHRFLLPTEVQALDRHPLITIGAHGHRHAALRAESEADAREDMALSKRTLELLLGHPVAHFAYPFGTPAAAGRREFRLAAECGFASAVTTRTKRFDGRDWYSIPRHAMREEHTAARLKIKLSGWSAFWRQSV